nr:penicillin-binding protein 1A [Bacillus methanolicus]
MSGVATFAYMIKDAPKLNEKLLKDPISSKIYDMNNHLIAEVGSEKRDYVDYDHIPKLVEHAVLATEDYRFYKHHGVDLIRLGGAVIANITHGFGSEGGSTITQQVVKNSFLTFDKTLKRKAQEAWLAFQLERKYTKHEIFEMYVNKVYMSEGVHGIATAAKIYFGKDLKDLTLPEAALLAGMPQSPNNYNPFEHPDRAEKRRNIVLSLMYKHGYITKEEMEKAQKVPVTSTLVKEEKRKKNDKPYDAFVDAVIDEVEKYGDFDIFSDGLKIYTTLDPDAQSYVEKMLNSNDIVQFPDDKFQAGIVLLDTKTGEIRAIGGGRNQKVKRGFNYAIDTRRQPGSTIKPILDYGPAIEYLKWGTYHTLVDEPYTYSDGTPINNWDNRHMGPMTMREALARSRNVPALKALQEVGLEKAKDFANRLGIPLKEIYESYAIGGLGNKDKGVSPLQMAGAYSAFGNNGFYTEPHAIRAIEFRDGTKIDTSPEPKVVMNDYTAFMITDMLKSVVKDPYGTGTRADIPGLPVAGKTGTTNYSQADRERYGIPDGAVPDSWFVGYTTRYTAAVWTGYKDQTENYIPAGDDQKISQYLFKNLMEHVSRGVETPDFEMPNSVERVRIEKGSVPAKLASEYTPENMVLYEYAVKGHAPSQVSEKFYKPEAPNIQAKYDEQANQIVLSWDYNTEGDNQGVQFVVNVSINGGPEQQLTVTEEKGFSIANPVPGGIYKFNVIAVKGNLQSAPGSATIQIPDPSNLGKDDKKGDNQNNGNQGDNSGNNGSNQPGSGNNQGGNGSGDGNTGGNGPGDNGGNGTGGNGGTGAGGNGGTGAGGNGGTGAGGNDGTGTGGNDGTGAGGNGGTGTGGNGGTGAGGNGGTGAGGSGSHGHGAGSNGGTGTGGNSASGRANGAGSVGSSGGTGSSGHTGQTTGGFSRNR